MGYEALIKPLGTIADVSQRVAPTAQPGDPVPAHYQGQEDGKSEVVRKPNPAQELNNEVLKGIENSDGVWKYFATQTEGRGFDVIGQWGSEVCVWKVGPSGEVWTQNFKIETDCNLSVRLTNDGGYLLIGKKNDKGRIVKTDRLGNKEWSREFETIAELEKAVEEAAAKPSQDQKPPLSTRIKAFFLGK